MPARLVAARSLRGSVRLKLDALNVTRLPAIDGKRTTYADTLTPGLVLRVSPTGNRSWAVVYRRPGETGPGRLHTIGKLEKIGLAAARDAARDFNARVRLGEDPRQERLEAKTASRRRRLTVAGLAERYLKDAQLRPSTRRDWERLAKVELVPLGSRSAADLKRGDVREWARAIAKRSPGVARNAFALLRRIYSWAVEEDVLVGSPFVGLKPPAKVAASERVLTVEELQGLFLGLARIQGHYPDVVRLLLLTMTRRSSVLGMRRDEFVDLDGANPRWIVPAARSKRRMGSNAPHVVPLVPWAVEIVKARMDQVGPGQAVLFPASRLVRVNAKPKSATATWPSRFVRNLRREVEVALGHSVPRWTVHNIRHAAATHMREELGIQEEVVDLLLGHTRRGSGALGIYDRSKLLPARRAALEAWEAYLRKLKDTARRADTGPTPEARRGRTRRRGRTNAVGRGREVRESSQQHTLPDETATCTGSVSEMAR